MTDFMSFSEELLQTTREAINSSKMYLDARKESSHCYNQLQVLIYKAGIHNSKKSPENKIIELMADRTYGEEARELNKKMTDAMALYKGLELVVKSFLAHSSALQSCIKSQISGEISENVRNKYELYNH